MMTLRRRPFLEAGLAIQVGTRNARLEPNGAPSCAVAVVEPDGTHLLAYVPEPAAAPRAPPISKTTARWRSCSRGRPTTAPAR